MHIKEIVEKTRETLKEISDNQRSVWSTTEWNICHHIACKLKERFKHYNVDVELQKIDGRRPDIVIHKQGDNENNLVVFQVKKFPSTQKIKDDINKIKETFFGKRYLYKFGIFISIGKLPKQLPKFDLKRICIIEIYGWKITSTENHLKIRTIVEE